VSAHDGKGDANDGMGDIITGPEAEKMLELEADPIPDHIIDHNPIKRQLFVRNFRKLEWSEHLALEDRPRYVKYRRYPAIRDLRKDPVVFRVADSPFPEDGGAPMIGQETVDLDLDDQLTIHRTHDFVPASKEEYDAQPNKPVKF
jgi:hypothetical protein